MKKLIIVFTAFLVYALQLYPASETLVDLTAPTDLTPLIAAEQPSVFKAPLLELNYKDTPLTSIVNELAAKKGLNILLPQGTQAIVTKLNYTSGQKLTVDQAWDKINSILEMLGYTWINHKEYLALKKIDPTTRREGLPLYVDVPIKELPDSPDMIQAIFYLANIKVSDQDNPIKDLLDKPDIGMLSKDAYVLTDEKTNALIITDHANTLKAAMHIIKELDLEGVPDAIEVMPLYYVQASFVETLFKDLLTQASDTQVSMIPTARKGTQQASYFPANTKIMGIDRTNSVVIMGSVKALQVVRDFIIKYIDHPLESGKSILHIYELKYLNAEDFQPILQNLVSGGGANQSGQSTGQANPVGPRRDFQDVIIVAEITKQTEAIAPTSAGDTSAPAAVSQGVQQGGNRLIIAARDHDWQRIKAIIQELDIQQPQVALEVLVVDLVLQRTRDLGSQIRNVDSILGPNVNFQSAQLNNIILPPATSDDSGNGFSTYPSDALRTNLLQFFQNQAGVNLANASDNGSLVISLQDPNNSGTWAVWQILSQYTNASMLAQPFIIAKDNKQATITVTQSRFLKSNATSEGGAVKTQQEWVTAPTTIDLVPRISKLASTINLQVIVSVDEFLSSQNNRITRQVQTNANVGDGEILAIGGLMRERDDIVERKVPLLGDIPLIGYFFKYKQKVRNKTNLLIFITPRIIRSNKPGSVGPYTNDKLCIAQEEMDEHFNLPELRDPITRWFFKPDVNLGARTIETFTEGRLADHDEVTNTTLLASNKNSSTTTPLLIEKSVPHEGMLAQAKVRRTSKISPYRQQQIKEVAALVEDMPALTT